MKNSTLATRLAMAAVFLAVIIYFGFSAASYFTDPYTATLAYSFVGERAVTVSGYVVRDEEVLPGGGELVYSNRREGERVSAGGTVAQIYQSAQALQDANILRSLQEQAEQLDYAAALAAGSRTSVRLDDEITSALIGVRQSMSAGGLTAAADQSAALRTAVLKRSYAYSGSGGLDASAVALRERISALAASADPGTARITAPRAGLFSSLVDGYESVLTRENILALTPSSYRAITPEAGAAGVGRLVYGTGWSFVTMMRTEDVGRMQPGDNLTLRFQKGLDRDMAMEVGGGAHLGQVPPPDHPPAAPERPDHLRELRRHPGAPLRRAGERPAPDGRGRRGPAGQQRQPHNPESDVRVLPVGGEGPVQAGDHPLAGGGVHPGGAGRGGPG